MKKPLLPTLLAIAVLTGCSSPTTTASAPTVAPTPPVVTPVPTPTPTSTVTPRGNLPKTVGQVFGSHLADGSTVASFVVNAITVDPPCASGSEHAPENGHFVKLDITGETMPALAPDNFFIGGWKVITDAGTTVNANPETMAAWSCLNDADRLRNSIGPGEKVAGSIVLDVPTPHGFLVLPFGSPNTGWEWNY